MTCFGSRSSHGGERFQTEPIFRRNLFKDDFADFSIFSTYACRLQARSAANQCPACQWLAAKHPAKAAEDTSVHRFAFALDLTLAS